jgi:uncharacterized protein
MADIALRDNAAAHRFELLLDGAVAAYAEYSLPQGAVLLAHTEVLPQYEGQGLGSKLAVFALGEVRRRGLHAIPVCQFMAGYIRRHPEYHDLVTQEHRRAFDA